MWYRSASFILDKQEQQRNDAVAEAAESRPLSPASTAMAAENPSGNISMYYQTRSAHHGVVTSDWLAQAQAAVAGNSDDAVSENNVSGGEEKDKRFSVVDEFNNWRKQPELAEAVAAIRALASVIRSSQAKTMMELEIELKKASDSLKSWDTTSISLTAGCDLFMRYVTRTSALDREDFGSAKSRLLERAEKFGEISYKARRIIAMLSQDFIFDGCTILVHGFSRVVLEVLRTAAENKKLFRVFCTEGRPDRSGLRVSNELAKLDIPVKLLIDSAVAYSMDDVDMVFVGADGVVESGGIINMMGTYQIALVAKAMNKPMYVAAESYKTVEDRVEKNNVPELELSATFADLPAPELEWEQMPSAPVPRLDGSAIQIADLLYVFSGYRSLDHVHSHIDVYNFTAKNWTERFGTPKEMAHSHLGVASDGRYVYIVSGQHGTQCTAPPVALSFVLDTKTRKWKSFPSLPAPRYAPATQIWRGRLHVMGGSKENRHTLGTDHWSIAVKNGKALEKEWRKEIPIPRGGPHRACIAVGDKLFVIGGQEGDFMPKPGSPIFKCSRRHEVVYGDVYMLDSEMKWKVLTPMPKPDSHIESSWIILNNSIIIMGGTTEKHPVTKRMILVGEVFQFHLDSLQWSVIGKLPYRVKTTLAGFWDGWLYFTSGQRDRGPDNPQPKKVIGEMWRTKLSL